MIGKIWKSSRVNAGRFWDFLGRGLKCLATTFFYYDVEHSRRAGEAAEKWADVHAKQLKNLKAAIDVLNGLPKELQENFYLAMVQPMITPPPNRQTPRPLIGLRRHEANHRSSLKPPDPTEERSAHIRVQER